MVNIGSIGGLAVADLDNFSYTASKAGLHMLTRHMAHVLVKDHVNEINGLNRVVRGGCFANNPASCRSPFRYNSHPTDQGNSGFGCRVCFNLE